MEKSGLVLEWEDRKIEPDIRGEICPVCGKKSWYIIKCNTCGKVFCKHCNPNAFKKDEEIDSLEITCDCGETTMFV